MKIPAGARRIDVSGKTIMPGLRGHPRAHWHRRSGVHRSQTAGSTMVNLAYGVTTTRDPQTGNDRRADRTATWSRRATHRPAHLLDRSGRVRSRRTSARSTMRATCCAVRRVLQHRDGQAVRIDRAARASSSSWRRASSLMPTTRGRARFQEEHDRGARRIFGQRAHDADRAALQGRRCSSSRRVAPRGRRR